MDSEKTAYDILNVLQKATAPEIKSAFTKQMVTLLLDTKEQASSEAWFRDMKNLIEAYETLSLPEKKEEQAAAIQPPVAEQTKEPIKTAAASPLSGVKKSAPELTDQKNTTTDEAASAEMVTPATTASLESKKVTDPSTKEKESEPKIAAGIEPVKNELIPNNAAEQAIAIAKINDLLPEYFMAKRSYSEANNTLIDATKKKDAVNVPGLLRWVFLAVFLLSAGWIFYNFAQGNGNPFGQSKEEVQWIKDSISNAQQDSIAAITIDSSLIEPISEFYEVSAAKTFFHDRPFASLKTMNPLLKGRRFKSTMKYGNFYYTEFENRFSGRLVSGWINGDDIKPSKRK